MSGTLALIFLLWGPSTDPNSPPEYRRSVLTPGVQRYTLPDDIPNREFYMARNRLDQGYKPSGGSPVGYDYSALPAQTMAECQAYLKSHYQFYEEVAKSRNQTIKAARCINIPIGKMLDAFHDDGYDDQGNRADAFRLRDIPKLPKQVGPDCANMRPYYPELAAEGGVDAFTVAECSSSKEADGYWHHQNCRITSVTLQKDGKPTKKKGSLKDFAASALTFLGRSCSALHGEPTTSPDVYIYRVNYIMRKSD